MRIENLLFSAVQFFLILVLSCAGVFFMALPWAPDVRFKCAAFLAQRDDLFIPLGGLLLAVAVILGIGFYFLQRKSFFQVNMNPAIHVEREVLHGILNTYWKNRFPSEKLKTDIVLHPDQKIELVAELPFLNIPEAETLLSSIESEISLLLLQHLGYKREFVFTFQLK